jgi:hypothetical protein
MKQKLEFFTMKEIIGYLSLFFFLGIFIGWSFSQYKISRLENISLRIDNFDNHQRKYESEVNEIKTVLNNSLTSFLNNLKINKIFSKCLKISSTNRVVNFDVEFSKVPQVFVTVNKFTITYGPEGTLEKTDISWTPAKDKIVFQMKDLEKNINVPVCILATEN